MSFDPSTPPDSAFVKRAEQLAAANQRRAKLESLVLQVEMALKDRTRSFHDEIKLHEEMEAAFKDFGIPCKREVPVQGGGFADFVLEDWCVVEVKANGGGGLSCVRQVMRYLEDERFLSGIIVCTRKLVLPVDHYVKPDGSIAPLAKVELWRNGL